MTYATTDVEVWIGKQPNHLWLDHKHINKCLHTKARKTVTSAPVYGQAWRSANSNGLIPCVCLLESCLSGLASVRASFLSGLKSLHPVCGVTWTCLVFLAVACLCLHVYMHVFVLKGENIMKLATAGPQSWQTRKEKHSGFNACMC